MPKIRVKKKSDKVSGANHSMNPDRPNAEGNMRSRSTIRRLRMVRNSKKRCNSKGEIVKAAAFQTVEKSGKMVHIEANRRYFGNTRVISDIDLDKAREYESTYDPYQVTLKKTLLPHAIKPNTKKPKPEFNFLIDLKRKPPKRDTWPGCTTFAEVGEYNRKKHLEYDESCDKMVTDKIEKDKPENSHLIFKAGTSQRVYKEIMNVIDSSDVLLYVLDIRNPLGTRNPYIERLLKSKPHKKLVFILNKLDLVPISVTRAWKRHFSAIAPTVVFYADMKHPFGKHCLLNLLKQLNILHKDRKMLNVGVIGYPNVGKSSLINTLIGKKVCKTAPLAGETKVWQFVAITKSIHIIDSPGVCCDHKDTETDLIVKGAVRVEKVPDPDVHVMEMIHLFKPAYLKQYFGLVEDWKDSEDFLETIAKKRGRLLKGGFPDIQTVSRNFLNDCQRGKLRYYFPPPNYVAKDETINDFFEFDKLLAEKTSIKNVLSKLDETEVTESLQNDEIEGSSDVEESDIKQTDKAEESEIKQIDEDEESEIKQTDKAEESEIKQIDEDEESEIKETVEVEEPEEVMDIPEKSEEEIDYIAFKPMPKKNVKAPKIEKKMTSKQRRRLERQMKDKKTGFNYYDFVDVKNKKSRKGKK